jgi:hypothetical protein
MTDRSLSISPTMAGVLTDVRQLAWIALPCRLFLFVPRLLRISRKKPSPRAMAYSAEAFRITVITGFMSVACSAGTLRQVYCCPF